MLKQKNKAHSHMDEMAMPPSRYQDAYAKLASDRNIFIAEDITKELAAEISGMLLYYDRIDDTKPIRIYCCTQGGDSSALCNIAGIMSIIHSPIHTINLSKAYSAGAFIMAAGTKGHRYAMKSSCTMLHGIQCDTPPADQKTSAIYLKFLQDHNKMVLSIMAKHTGKSLEQIEKDCAHDVYMNAQEALEYGIIDHIL